MNVKFLNPFVDAATEVLQAECEINAIRGNLNVQKACMKLRGLSNPVMFTQAPGGR